MTTSLTQAALLAGVLVAAPALADEGPGFAGRRATRRRASGRPACDGFDTVTSPIGERAYSSCANGTLRIG
jgi:hypothetical protein